MLDTQNSLGVYVLHVYMKTHTYTQTLRQTDIHMHTERETYRDRQTHTYTNAQCERDRHTQRDSHRQTQTDRHIHTYTPSNIFLIWEGWGGTNHRLLE